MRLDLWEAIVACILSLLSVAASKNKCEICRIFVQSFHHGMKVTEKAHFGGGNTQWETDKLGKYARSETRLVEILENACKKSADGKDIAKGDESKCESFVEEYEEQIENWYFHKQSNNPDFFTWLCMNTVKICCPEHRWGPKCEPCPGDPERPCTGNGECLGSGTTEGTGKCKCKSGYIGNLCRKCSSNYYASFKNDTHISCSSCDRSCSGGCSGDGPRKCNKCRKGWILDRGGCTDVNECLAAPSPCTGEYETCRNTIGSFDCPCMDGYSKRSGKCVLDPNAQGKKPREWTSPESILRTTSVAGLIFCFFLIMQRRSYGLGIFYAIIVSVVLYIEFGPGANLIANHTAGIDPEALKKMIRFGDKPKK